MLTIVTSAQQAARAVGHQSKELHSSFLMVEFSVCLSCDWWHPAYALVKTGSEYFKWRIEPVRDAEVGGCVGKLQQKR